MSRWTVFSVSALTPNYAAPTRHKYAFRLLAMLRARSLNRWNRAVGSGVVSHFETRRTP